MGKIITIDCGEEVINALSELLGDEVAFVNESFENIRDLKEYSMIIIQDGINRDEILKRIRKLRHACYFRNMPIICIKKEGNIGSIEPYVTSGATEVLSLSDPPIACQQILKGYLAPNRKPLDEEMEYIDSFIRNTCNVLKTTASVEASFQEVYFINDFKIFGDISGIIGLSGATEGILGITFYWPLAQMIIAQMMGVDEDQINAELIHDGVAEIINMISGSTKKEFVGKPHHFEISLPSVIVGSGHQISHSEDTSIAVLIFKVNFQYFALQVCLNANHKNKKKKG